MRFVVANGPDFRDQLHARFGGWIFNVLAFKIFGVSEFSYFMPTMIMSAGLGVIGYFLLLVWNYPPFRAFWAGLFISSAPFEVLLGSLRANDVILTFFMAVGIFSFFYLEKKPVFQGFVLAFCAWFSFYVKLWIVYFFPVLGIYFLVKLIKFKEWKVFVSFSAFSFLFHFFTVLYWKIKIGVFFPFLNVQGGSYPIPWENVPALLKVYPKMIFQGSEFGTTFFGYVPYLLVVLLILKIIPGPGVFKNYKMEKTDYILLVLYGTFFLFLNFFPMNFKFDQYYSAHRIFRYLTPLSFPMTLHLAKLIIDFGKGLDIFRFSRRPATVSVLLLGILTLNLIQAAEATGPGRNYRSALMSLIGDLREFSGGTVYVESWLGFFMREVYFMDKGENFRFIVNPNAHKAEQYEDWLKEIQPNLQEGTFLITGIGSNVHYGGHFDGFRLEQFNQPLDTGWKRVGEYETLSFLPIPEPARLWAWKNIPDPGRGISKKAMSKKGDINDPDRLFAEGMEKFDAGACSEAKEPFSLLIENFPKHHLADDGFYFRSICEYSKGRWFATIEEFNRLLELYPESTWAAGAHYHMGISYRRLNNSEAARKEFGIILRDYALDKTLVDLSNIQLKEMDSE